MPAALALADVIIEALARHGVERIFGVPGGGSSLALIEAAYEVGIDFVLTRTETATAIGQMTPVAFTASSGQACLVR